VLQEKTGLHIAHSYKNCLFAAGLQLICGKQVIAMGVCWSAELLGKVSLKLITSECVIRLIRVINVMAVWSLLTENPGKPHNSSPQYFIRTFLSCSVFFVSLLWGDFYECDLIHIDFLSLTHRFTLPRNRRWFESLKGRCFLKSLPPSHISNTLSGSTTSRVRETCKHLHFLLSLLQIATTIYTM